MPAPQGVYRFPGVQGAVSATYTLSHGISPGHASLEMAPQVGFVGSGGALELLFAGSRLVFPGMKADLVNVHLTPQGHVWKVNVYDRRWKWHFGELNGYWNMRDDSNRVPPHLVRTPQQLAEACLIALGETGYDVSQLPNDTFPEVEWDRSNPAQQLGELCEALGCRVVLTLNNTIQICLAGVGAALPTADLMHAQASINPPERPDSIKVVGGKARFQNDWVLVAVGLDHDGKIKPIDDLSYNPNHGWAKEDPLYFSGVRNTLTQPHNRELAKRTVYRWYRLANLNMDGTKPLKLPGSEVSLAYGHQIELEDTQVDTQADRQLLAAAGFAPVGVTPQAGSSDDDLHRSLPAEVYGVFYDGALTFANTDEHTIYRGGFRILKEEQIVEFPKAVFQFNANGTKDPADLYIRTAATIRDSLSWTPIRYEKTATYSGGQWNTGPRILRHDEIVAQYAAVWETEPSSSLAYVRDNLAECAQAADYWLAAADLEYQDTAPVEAVYAGIKAISPDGAIQQVTWSVGPSGATTRVCRNNEFSTRVPKYSDRRFAEKLRGDALGAFLRMAQENRKKIQKKKKP